MTLYTVDVERWPGYHWRIVVDAGSRRQALDLALKTYDLNQVPGPPSVVTVDQLAIDEVVKEAEA